MAIAGDHVVVTLDDASGIPRTFDAGDIISVDIGLAYQVQEMTAGSTPVQHHVTTLLQAPVTLKGYLTTTSNTGTHTVIQGAFAAQTVVTLDIQIGQNAPPTSGDPSFSGEFYIERYQPTFQANSAVMFTAQLVPATDTAPAWGTVSP